jgi:SPP1 family predicted phage head-tail adaptor
MDTQAGELNRRITLQYPTKVSDGMGGFTVSWIDAATVWAKISTLRSDEALIAMQETGTAIHNVVIRYRSDVKSSWRIKYGNDYWDIIGPPIDVNKEHRFLDIKAKETAS